MDDGCVPQHQQSNGGGATVHHHPASSTVNHTQPTGNKIAHNNNNNQQHHVGMQSNHQPPFLCSGCATPIVDQYLLKALDCYWHEDCLKCGCCDCRLGEVGSTLYTKANLILCKRDYLRMFGTSGNCAACCKPIPAFEMVMRAKSNVYHLDCFACQQCHQRFCVGDRFYLNDNKILCEYDYEERVLALNMPSNNNASTQHIQRRVSDIPQSGDGAIGYDSQASQSGNLFHQQQLGYDQFSDGTHFVRGAPSVYQQQYATNRQVQHLASRNNQHKHGSPSDGSSSGYGSPDSILLDER
ncbi:LIM/homeobox protein Awh-like isoform X1 [Daphnia carinata]|uniref:LIM/homeobox protein Awh-like isoform X1 n=1 Tax=Daphnia carinata TaxID=120202 RepID=UPI0025810E8D|nr:LIM/homeobox protein Awh-like isoform X1 [Daphnia carinata]